MKWLGRFLMEREHRKVYEVSYKVLKKLWLEIKKVIDETNCYFLNISSRG